MISRRESYLASQGGVWVGSALLQQEVDSDRENKSERDSLKLPILGSGPAMPEQSPQSFEFSGPAHSVATVNQQEVLLAFCSRVCSDSPEVVFRP